VREEAGATAMAPQQDDDVWTVLRLMTWSGDYLKSKGVERGRLDAEHLLAHALGVPRLQLYLQYDRPLDKSELDRFRPLLRRRAAREPLQYIVGRAAFRELDLKVDSRVLIPRPETEVLVDEVLAWCQGSEDLTALDLGTGSGAIALSLLVEGPFRKVMATDVSADALDLAGENARDLGLESRLELRLGSLFDAVEPGQVFDVVVSNPPYIADAEAVALQPEVGVWEPGHALFGGPDGLSVLRSVIQGAGAVLRTSGLLALEVGERQPGIVVTALEATGDYEDVRVRRDLSGRQRVVLARRAGAS
jgi:release factor glutamine methyltransferase